MNRQTLLNIDTECTNVTLDLKTKYDNSQDIENPIEELTKATTQREGQNAMDKWLLEVEQNIEWPWNSKRKIVPLRMSRTEIHVRNHKTAKNRLPSR